jgi:5-methylcytosine-specific restriction protein B
MIYIRNIFTQDLRDGKQIAFPTEPSNLIFKFNFRDTDPDRKISFRFKVNDKNSVNFLHNDRIINTRLYSAGSESRIDGELKQFLRDTLNAEVDDIIVFRSLSLVSYEFEFIAKGTILYPVYKMILNGKNHEIILSQDDNEQLQNDIDLKFRFLDLSNLKEDFATWFIKLDGIKHNYYSDSFGSNRDKFIEQLTKYDYLYNEQFGTNIFNLENKDLNIFINDLERNLYLEEGSFYQFSLKTSSHMPRAILGKKNYIKFLKELTVEIKIPQIDFDLSSFQLKVREAGLIFSNELIQRFIASLSTKPFVILTGLSGSGKTKLAQAFVQWICQDGTQYRIIPVGADWTNREPLLGYPNALKPEEYVKPDSGVLDLIIQANHNPNLPHFLVLDEMNLSHVERYFADFLSVMESKEEIPLHSEGKLENGVPHKLKVPSNLFIIGTVNIDETTNMFSPKVLDRANTIEFRVTQDEMKNFLVKIKDINMDSLIGKGAGMAESFLNMAESKEFAANDLETINNSLVQFFGELKKTGSEFGYRSATEILRLMHQLTSLDPHLTTNKKIDIAIMQKLLPKLHGSRRKLCPVLETLGTFCIAGDIKIIKDVFEKADFDFNGELVLYPLSLEKITRMYRGAIDNGFASYAEA